MTETLVVKTLNVGGPQTNVVEFLQGGQHSVVDKFHEWFKANIGDAEWFQMMKSLYNLPGDQYYLERYTPLHQYVSLVNMSTTEEMLHDPKSYMNQAYREFYHAWDAQWNLKFPMYKPYLTIEVNKAKEQNKELTIWNIRDQCFHFDWQMYRLFCKYFFYKPDEYKSLYRQTFLQSKTKIAPVIQALLEAIHKRKENLVYCLQEVNKDQYQILVDQLKRYRSSISVSRFQNGTVTCFPTHLGLTKEIPALDQWIHDENKETLILSNGHLVVVNTHLSGKVEKAKQQWQHLADRIYSALSNQKLPPNAIVMVAGDMNHVPNVSRYQQQRITPDIVRCEPAPLPPDTVTVTKCRTFFTPQLKKADKLDKSHKDHVVMWSQNRGMFSQPLFSWKRVRVETMNGDQVGEDEMLPNSANPSDHWVVAAELEVIKRSHSIMTHEYDTYSDYPRDYHSNPLFSSNDD